MKETFNIEGLIKAKSMMEKVFFDSIQRDLNIKDDEDDQAEAQAKYESDMARQAEAEAENEMKIQEEIDENARKSSSFDNFDNKLKAIAETLQGQIEEMRVRIEALEKT